MMRFALITTFLAALSGVFLKGDFGHGIIVGCLVVFVVGPLALYMALWALFSLKRSGSIPDALKRTFSISAILGCGLLLSLATGVGMNRWEIYRTREFVAAIVPKLDAYRAKHGAFPASLREVGVARPPALLEDGSGYTAQPDYFKFEYWDPSGMMDGAEFSSSIRQWIHFD
jgi:hypothetical protein